MSVRLTIRTGKEPGKSAELVDGELTIGRDEASDLTISDDKVSRKHAVVELDREGRAVLRDLDSRNGTFVNGEQVRSAVLNAGDHLRFGDTVVIAESRPISKDKHWVVQQILRRGTGEPVEIAEVQA